MPNDFFFFSFCFSPSKRNVTQLSFGPLLSENHVKTFWRLTSFLEEIVKCINLLPNTGLCFKQHLIHNKRGMENTTDFWPTSYEVFFHTDKTVWELRTRTATMTPNSQQLIIPTVSFLAWSLSTAWSHRTGKAGHFPPTFW